jgi:hypothetical protein
MMGLWEFITLVFCVGEYLKFSKIKQLKRYTPEDTEGQTLRNA